MKRDQVQVGKVYAVKVSGTVQPVRIVRDTGVGFTYKGKERHGGWEGKNENTGREVRVHSAAKLRYELVKLSDGRWGLGPEIPVVTPGNPPRKDTGALRDSIPTP